MSEAPEIATIAALFGDAARARMLSALMSGCALTATELALEAGVAPSTASAHLAKLTEAGILALERQGRHRYFRLKDGEVASLLEALMGLSARPAPRPRSVPADPALCAARVCYDHLAGAKGVRLFESLREREILTGRDGDGVSPAGARFFTRFGLDLDALALSRRPLCRTCLDWSERRPHLAGALGAAILSRVFALGWARREPLGRAVLFTRTGERAFDRLAPVRVLSG